MRKGIIMCGGSGTRIYPINVFSSKHLLPIYDKPMIYYSLSTLLLANIKDIQIVTNEEHFEIYKKSLQRFNKLGINLSFTIQNKPSGIAECFKLCKNFIGKSKIAIILGDNFFFGNNFHNIIQTVTKYKTNCLFTYKVNNPNEYGVVKKNKKNIPLDIIEKPKNFISNEIVTGLYFYNNDVLKLADKLKPSKRGELEITDLNRILLKKKRLKIINLGRGISWFDIGSPNSLHSATNFVESIQSRETYKLGCVEEILLRKKMISKEKLKKYIEKIPAGDYKNYLKKI